MVTLIAVASLVATVGLQYTLLIATVAGLIYMYPFQTMLCLFLLGYLKWQGMVLKQKLINYWNKRKPK